MMKFNLISSHLLTPKLCSFPCLDKALRMYKPQSHAAARVVSGLRLGVAEHVVRKALGVQGLGFKAYGLGCPRKTAPVIQ